MAAIVPSKRKVDDLWDVEAVKMSTRKLFAALANEISGQGDTRLRKSILLSLNRFVHAAAKENHIDLGGIDASGEIGAVDGWELREGVGGEGITSSEEVNKKEDGKKSGGGANGSEREDGEEDEGKENNGEENDRNNIEDVVVVAEVDEEESIEDEESEDEEEDHEGRRRIPYKRLRTTTLRLSDDIDGPALTVARDSFFEALSLLEGDSASHLGLFTEDEVVAITNFFFGEMMGEKAYVRLRRLVDSYSVAYEQDVDKGAAARAEAAARNDLYAPKLKEFFTAFARAQRTRSSNQLELTAFQQMQLHIDLLDRYESLCKAANQRDKTLLASLKGCGYQPKRGVGWASLVSRFLAERVGLSTTSLQNACQQALGIKALTRQFGNGIIGVLPPGSMTKLNRWGNGRMAKVYPILRHQAPFLLPVCQLLDEHLYQPVANGGSLTIGRITNTPGKHLLGRITDAVESKQ